MIARLVAVLVDSDDDVRSLAAYLTLTVICVVALMVVVVSFTIHWALGLFALGALFARMYSYAVGGVK